MMPFRKLLAVAAVLSATIGSAAFAEKNPPTSRRAAYALPTKPGSTVFNPDLIFDYQVWAAPEELHWYVVAEYTDGSVTEYRSFSETGAKQWQQWPYFHIAELKKATVVSRLEPGEYVLIQTFDKSADAQDFAALLQSLSLYVEIRSVSTLQFNQLYLP